MKNEKVKRKLSEMLLITHLAVNWSLSMKTISKAHSKTSKSYSLLLKYMQNIKEKEYIGIV